MPYKKPSWIDGLSVTLLITQVIYIYSHYNQNINAVFYLILELYTYHLQLTSKFFPVPFNFPTVFLGWVKNPLISTVPIWHHFALDCVCCLITKSCATLCNPMDCSLPGSSVHGISQARILEWVAISFARGSSWLRDRTCISCTDMQSPSVLPPRKPLLLLQIPLGTRSLRSSWLLFVMKKFYYIPCIYIYKFIKCTT